MPDFGWFIILFVIIFTVAKCIRIVPQEQAWIVQRLGTYSRTLDAGLHVLIPIVDAVAYKHSLTECIINVPPQQCVTKDKIPVEVDGILYMRVVDAVKASYCISNYLFSTTQLAQTTMRIEIGKLDLNRTFEQREFINASIIESVDKASQPWGVKLTRCAIKNITPAQSNRDAMERPILTDSEKQAITAESQGASHARIDSADVQNTCDCELKNGECPEGHGPLRLWEGRPRCWTCGFVPPNGAEYSVSNPSKIREKGETVIVLAGSDITTHIEQLATESYFEAAEALGDLGDSRAVPALIQTFKRVIARDNLDMGVCFVIRALAKLKDERAVPVLLHDLVQRSTAREYRGDSTLVEVIKSLAALGAKDAVPMLQQIIDELPCLESSIFLDFDGNAVVKDCARNAIREITSEIRTSTVDEQYELGRKHAEGNGVRQDDVEAVKWYKLAAQHGHAGAQNNLGAMYVAGRGVSASDAEGFAWYKKAAEQGHESAQNNLGVMFYLGKGTYKNLTEAKKWWKLAAEQGNSSAQKHLGMV